MDIMIDLETLGTRPDAMMIQLGAVAFEAKSGGRVFNDRTFGQHIIIQDGCGTIDNGTLAFWLTQPHAKAMGEALLNVAVPLQGALAGFVEWISGLEEDFGPTTGVWAKPSNFDIPILSHKFALFGQEPPWNHRVTRCARTLFALVGGEPEIDWTGFMHHDAVDNAIGQAMMVQKAFAVAS